MKSDVHARIQHLMQGGRYSELFTLLAYDNDTGIYLCEHNQDRSHYGFCLDIHLATGVAAPSPTPLYQWLSTLTAAPDAHLSFFYYRYRTDEGYVSRLLCSAKIAVDRTPTEKDEKAILDLLKATGAALTASGYAVTVLDDTQLLQIYRRLLAQPVIDQTINPDIPLMRQIVSADDCTILENEDVVQLPNQYLCHYSAQGIESRAELFSLFNAITNPSKLDESTRSDVVIALDLLKPNDPVKPAIPKRGIKVRALDNAQDQWRLVWLRLAFLDVSREDLIATVKSVIPRLHSTGIRFYNDKVLTFINHVSGLPLNYIPEVQTNNRYILSPLSHAQTLIPIPRSVLTSGPRAHSIKLRRDTGDIHYLHLTDSPIALIGKSDPHPFLPVLQSTWQLVAFPEELAQFTAEYISKAVDSLLTSKQKQSDRLCALLSPSISRRLLDDEAVLIALIGTLQSKGLGVVLRLDPETLTPDIFERFTHAQLVVECATCTAEHVKPLQIYTALDNSQNTNLVHERLGVLVLARNQCARIPDINVISERTENSMEKTT